MASPTQTRRRLFRDETVLTDSYTPDTPVGRDDIVAQLLDAARPVTHRKPADNVVLIGPPGTGKTTVVTHVLDYIAQETRVATAAINCWQYNTRPALLAELLIQFGYPAPRKGTPVDERLGTLREWLAKSDGAIIALDEFDQHADQTAVVYDLLEAVAGTDNELGLLLVSNQPLGSLAIDARSRSRLNCRTLTVEPYTADDLAAILQERVEKAFQRDVVSSEAVDQIAAMVADASGDCRQAFNLLLRAGRLAEQEQASEVTVDHVEETLTEARVP